ncbi:hypothetical protein BU25DRAFT_413110 [Macroventuria anomochaeta]|uniref:Uncharacterized protein n=1 Tax=Macroventuria anomochaeta TaxID=301207 RepID=A0ACB6RSB4_9PLEO|nr:uncharacterized protein BU25DRAFT_413110 [Macroventuria anomochaeta]KAF2624936.1 hypothetical protein BU25DRAFT_413110 [Macroventuria anomochaeta]
MPMYLEHSRSQQSVYKGSLPSCSDNSCLQFKTQSTPSIYLNNFFLNSLLTDPLWYSHT